VHIDADVLDASLQPNHPTVEPDGLDVQQTLAIVGAAMQSGKVVAFGVVSINPEEPGGRVSLRSGMELIVGGVSRWATRDGIV
jgi:arginase family enzyme